MHVCLCNHVLVNVDFVQQACLPFTTDHEQLVETAETLSVQTLTPVCEDPPHLLIQSLTQLSIIHMHLLSTADVWQEMSTPENLDDNVQKIHTNRWEELRENAVNTHLITYKQTAS